MMLTALITHNYHTHQLLAFVMDGQELYFVLLAVASQAVRSKQRCRWHPQMSAHTSFVLTYLFPGCICFIAEGLLCLGVYLAASIRCQDAVVPLKRLMMLWRGQSTQN